MDNIRNSLGFGVVVILVVGVFFDAVNSSLLAQPSAAAGRRRRLSSRLFPRFQGFSPDCASLGDGYFANQEDCHTFFFCRAGIPYPFTCPFPYQFHPERSICYWTGQLGCSEITLGQSTSYRNSTLEKKVKVKPTHVGHQNQYQHKGTNPELQPETKQGEVASSRGSYRTDEQVVDYQSTPANDVTTDQPYSQPRVQDIPKEYPESNYKEHVAQPTEAEKVVDALQTWMDFAFLYSYTKYVLPSEREVNVGSKLYQILKHPIHQPKGTLSISQNISLYEMQQIVDHRQLQGFISEGEQKTQKELLASSNTSFFNTIREHAVLNNDGEIIYGVTGLLQLSRNGGIRGTILNSFRTFKLRIPFDYIDYSRSDVCIMWGQFCKINLIIEGLEKDTANALAKYMRNVTLNQFAVNEASFFSSLQTKAYGLMGVLPEGVRYAVQEIIDSSGKRPDQVLSEAHLNGEKLGL